MECNAFGVRAIGHIVRLRDNGPSGTPFGRIGYTGCIGAPHPDQLVCINQSRQHRIGFYAEGVTFQSPGSPRQRRTLGLHAARNPNPNGVLQMRDAAYQSFARHEHRHARRAIVQPRWGNHIAVRPLPGVRGVAANPGLWNVTPSAYVPLVISFDYAITVHRVHRSDASGTPYFYKCGEIHIICVSQTTKM